MTLDAKDFKRLQWAILLFVVLAVAGGASVWFAQQLKEGNEKALQEATAARRNLQNKLARAREEEQELRTKIGQFEALKARGYVGPEQRLDWIEALARIKAARKIFRMDYEFAPQRPADAGVLPGGAAAGGFEVMASQMKLQLQLLHEGELLAVLGDLRDAVQAMIQVRSCVVERNSAGSGERARNAQIRADCTLEWITLREGR